MLTAFDRLLQKRPVFLICVAFLCLALFLFAPILFEERLFSGLYVNLYHVFFFAGQKYLIFTLHQWPNWWPHFASGYPISLTLDGFLNPMFILALKFLPVLPAYAWLTFFLFVANGASCYACARAFSLTRAASVIAALAYGFSGIIIRWTDVIVFASIFPILPLSFLAVLKIKQGNRTWRWIWTALLTYAWIGGFAELLVYDLIAIGAFCVTLLLADKPLTLKKFMLDGFRHFFLPVFVSVLLVSPWLVSVLYFITHDTIRAGGLAVADASSMPLTISYLIHVFLPRLSVFYGDNIPYLRLGDDIDLFLGTVPVLLLISLFFSWKKTSQRHRGFFVGLLAFALLMSFRSPMYLLLHQLPVLNWFRWHFKWSFLTVFAAAILAGYAMDALRAVIHERWAKRTIIIGWTALCLAVLGSFSIMRFAPTLQNKIVSFGMAHYAASASQNLSRSADYYAWLIRHMADSLVQGLSLSNQWIILLFALWATALASFTIIAWQRISWTRSRQLLVLATALGCVLPWTGFLVGLPNRYLTEEPATAAFLHRANAYWDLPVSGAQAATHVPYRVFPYFPDQSVADLQDRYRINFVDHDNRSWLSREMLDDNNNTWFGIDGMFNHEPLTEARMAALFEQVMGRTATATKDSLAANIRFFSSTHTAELLGIANVKYVTSPHILGGPWKLAQTSHILEKRVPVYLYENPFFRPRWYFADRVSASDGLSDMTFLERKGADELQLVAYTAGRLELSTKTAEGRWIVFSETGVPFWRAKIDGKKTPLIRANLAYQAVFVPAGTGHRVEFYYLAFWEQARASLTAFIKGR